MNMSWFSFSGTFSGHNTDNDLCNDTIDGLWSMAWLNRSIRYLDDALSSSNPYFLASKAMMQDDEDVGVSKQIVSRHRLSK